MSRVKDVLEGRMTRQERTVLDHPHVKNGLLIRVISHTKKLSLPTPQFSRLLAPQTPKRAAHPDVGYAQFQLLLPKSKKAFTAIPYLHAKPTDLQIFERSSRLSEACRRKQSPRTTYFSKPWHWMIGLICAEVLGEFSVLKLWERITWHWLNSCPICEVEIVIFAIRVLKGCFPLCWIFAEVHKQRYTVGLVFSKSHGTLGKL